MRLVAHCIVAIALCTDLADRPRPRCAVALAGTAAVDVGGSALHIRFGQNITVVRVGQHHAGIAALTYPG